MGKRTQKQVVPIIIEPHPAEYTGYPFITLLQYKQDHVLTIIDNTTPKRISALVLDFCGPEQINESGIIDIAIDWYEAGCVYPLSIEFSKRNLTYISTKLFRSFEVEFITRVIGPLPKYNMESCSIKRRRKKALPTNVDKIQNQSTIKL